MTTLDQTRLYQAQLGDASLAMRRVIQTGAYRREAVLRKITAQVIEEGRGYLATWTEVDAVLRQARRKLSAELR